MSLNAYDAFAIAWWIAFTYIASLGLLALRLGWLRSSGRVPAAPTALSFLGDKLGLGAVGFIFSARHQSFSDPAVSTLVMISRVLFVTYFPLFAFIIWRDFT